MSLRLEEVPLGAGSPLETNGQDPDPVLGLISTLCGALAAEGVRYCHWKSNEALHRSASGDNDLDLLVLRADVGRFTEILYGLGFKEARLPAKRELPGVFHYYGLDVASGRLAHVHSQTQLILGDDTTKNYRLPMEEAYLASAAQGPLFAVPAPEYELAVFVVRMVLKHATWDAIGYGRGRLGSTERRELAWLEERAGPADVAQVLRAHMPYVSEALWQSCRQSLRSDSTGIFRVRTARQLREALAGNARHSPRLDTTLRVWRRASWGTQRHMLRRRPRKRLAGGGALVAVVGGDGAGKSSAVEGLCAALSQTFLTTRVHLGKPPRSATTLAVKIPMQIANRFGMFPSIRLPPWVTATPGWIPSYPWLLWHALSARDRHKEYSRARRFAGRGGLVVCDRYPLPQLTFMDGTRMRGVKDADRLPWPARLLVQFERRSYLRIGSPDVLVILRVDPEIAVARRHDEDGDLVRRRNQQVWATDWAGTAAIIVDAGQAPDAVLRDVVSAAWGQL